MAREYGTAFLDPRAPTMCLEAEVGELRCDGRSAEVTYLLYVDHNEGVNLWVFLLVEPAV